MVELEGGPRLWLGKVEEPRGNVEPGWGELWGKGKGGQTQGPALVAAVCPASGTS